MELQVEKTYTLSVDKQTIAVSQLPDKVKEQVKLFDQLRQDTLEQSYKLNVYQLATEQKRLQLEQLVMEHLKQQYDAEPDEKGD